MKHARPDYTERIQDSAGLIPDDEPVLLVRGQDKLALRTLDFYIEASLRENPDPKVTELLADHRDRLAVWQATHATKVADLP